MSAEMKSILLAMLVAAGIGLAGADTDAVAAPADGMAIGLGVDASTAVEQVQHRRDRSRRLTHSRWRSQRHWRRGSRGGRCHFPGISAWVRC